MSTASRVPFQAFFFEGEFGPFVAAAKAGVVVMVKAVGSGLDELKDGPG